MKLIHKGAEAKIYLDKKHKIIIKERNSKKYRHPLLDEKLRKQRTKQEFKILKKAFDLGIKVPKPIKIEDHILFIEYIPGNDLKTKYKQGVEETIGEILTTLHNNNIIHGDVTLKNFILSENKRLYIIDFGLSFISSRYEDKAMDLFVLEETSKDMPLNMQKVLENYIPLNKEKIIERLEKIRKRRRYL